MKTRKATKQGTAKKAMRLVLRTDLGGRAASLASLTSISGVKVAKPFVLLAGGNGAGKSSLFAALRQATSLVGTGIGRFADHRGAMRAPLRWPSSWEEDLTPVDLARHALLLQDPYRRWGQENTGNLPEDAVGVLDPEALGWKGQRVWLHDGRVVDQLDSLRGEMNLTAMRRAADDRIRSHGEQMTGRLRYAVAWALGMFDLPDAYDLPEPDPKEPFSRRENEAVPRNIFERLAGHRAGEPGRTGERWLLLDEPETGLDPDVFARLMAMLIEGAGVGKLRVFCATHTMLALDLAGCSNVQVIDMDGYAARIRNARRMLADPERRAAAAAAERQLLAADTEGAVAEDRGLQGQGQFTAHEAMSVPYRDAVKAPYGKPELLERMRSAEQPQQGVRGASERR